MPSSGHETTCAAGEDEDLRVVEGAVHALGQRVLAVAEVGELAAQLLAVGRHLRRRERSEVGEHGLCNSSTTLRAQLRSRQAGILGQHVLRCGSRRSGAMKKAPSRSNSLK